MTDAEHFTRYERLINGVAARAMPRMVALDPTMEYDEVKAFCNAVYVRCKAGFDPSRNLHFSTYLQTALHWEINRLCEHLARERRVVMQRSVQDLVEAFDEEMDYYRTFADVAGSTPEESLELKQEAVRIIAGMSPQAREAISLLCRPTVDLLAYEADTRPKRYNARPITLDLVCAFLGYRRKEALGLREELKRLSGVDFPKLNGSRFA